MTNLRFCVAILRGDNAAVEKLSETSWAVAERESMGAFTS